MMSSPTLTPERKASPPKANAYRRRSGEFLSEAEREAEILRHLPLVHTVVDRVCAHLPPNVERDDLFHAGVIGLMDAIARFDASRDNAFSTYAVMRIRGAVIDELRARDWVPRSARERAKDYQRSLSELSHRLGRAPTDAELAESLGVDPAELSDIERQAHLATQVSIDQPVGENVVMSSLMAAPDGELANPARHLERDDLRQALVKVLSTLSEQERLVIKMYYFEELLLKEIAAVLGVTESRVCQIHGRVMGVLRARITDYL